MSICCPVQFKHSQISLPRSPLHNSTKLHISSRASLSYRYSYALRSRCCIPTAGAYDGFPLSILYDNTQATVKQQHISCVRPLTLYVVPKHHGASSRTSAHRAMRSRATDTYLSTSGYVSVVALVDMLMYALAARGVGRSRRGSEERGPEDPWITRKVGTSNSTRNATPSISSRMYALF